MSVSGQGSLSVTSSPRHELYSIVDCHRDNTSVAKAEGPGLGQGYWHYWPAPRHLSLRSRQVSLLAFFGWA